MHTCTRTHTHTHTPTGFMASNSVDLSISTITTLPFVQQQKLKLVAIKHLRQWLNLLRFVKYLLTAFKPKQIVKYYGSIDSLGTLRDSWRRALEMEHLSLWVLEEEGLLYWRPWRLCRKGSGNGYLSIRAPLGNLEGGSFTRDFERWMKGALEVEHLSPRELYEGNLEGGLRYW